jgi:uncharacterized membrane protein YvbJ
MYCPKCGQQTPEEGNFCQKCGAALTQVTPPPQRPLEKERTSGLAITSLVLGIVAFLFNPLAILAMIFGAIAMSQTGRNSNLKGRGMAITGLVLGIIVAAFWIIALIWLSSIAWWL